MKRTLKKNLQMGAALALSGLLAACGKLGFQGTSDSGPANRTLSKSEFPTSPQGDRTLTVHLDLVTMAGDIAPMLACAMNKCGDIKATTLINGLGRIDDESVTPKVISPDAQIDVSYSSDLAGGADCLKVAEDAVSKGASLEIVAVADHVEKLYYGIGVGYAGGGTVPGSESGVANGSSGGVKDPLPPVLTLSPDGAPDCYILQTQQDGSKISACPIPVDPIPLPPIQEEPYGYGVTLKSIKSCKIGPVVMKPPQPMPLPPGSGGAGTEPPKVSQ